MVSGNALTHFVVTTRFAEVHSSLTMKWHSDASMRIRFKCLRICYVDGMVTVMNKGVT